MPELCQDLLGNLSKSSLRPFEKYLTGIGNSLGNAQRVLETFPATFTEQRIHFGKCPNRSRDPLGAFPSASPANRKQGYLLAYYPPCLRIYQTCSADFNEAQRFVLNLIKNRRHNRTFFFNYQQFFSYFFSFQPYHFCPNSNQCDSPFKHSHYPCGEHGKNKGEIKKKRNIKKTINRKNH
jgi:hypothetical protein